MKIIPASYIIEPRDEVRGGMWNIMQGARVCYKTDEAASIEDGGERIVRMLIGHRHESPLEHGDCMFLIDDYHIFDNVAMGLRRCEEETGHHIHLTMTSVNGRHIISGNIRAWREFMAANTTAKYYFSGHIDPVYIGDILPEIEREAPDPRVMQIRSDDLRGAFEWHVHLRQSVRFIIDRGISHEFVRHRVMSFSQESTRFANYSQERFGSEITVIMPPFFAEGSTAWLIWKMACMDAEEKYFALLNIGLKPEEARGVLPTCVKTELYMTGTLGQWQHFFDLRALAKAGRPHPQALEVAKPLCLEMANRFPGAIVID